MKKLLKYTIILLITFLVLLVFGFSYYKSQLEAVATDSDELVVFEVKEGEYLNTTLDRLESEGLIKSAFYTKVYLKFNDMSGFKFGTYQFSPSLKSVEILEMMIKGSDYYPDQISLTFIEGFNIKQYAMVVEEKTIHSGEDFINHLNNEAFIDSLIEKYWFITEDVKNPKLYFPLEGYLSPNTYILSSDEAALDELYYKMLDQTDMILSAYKDTYKTENIESIHQLLSLASIVELEAFSYEDRQGVANVFHNRLNIGYQLGSCVTSYYGVGVLLSERNLYNSEFNDDNDYNTRGTIAGLPIGPISNPSKAAIEATINYIESDDLYFVSDINRKIHFTKTYDEHLKIIAKLKKEGLWLEW